ncbi:MAG: hypothetical protein DMG01_23010 [Acidobacteria bacterium]|nr:MAG: hypothetical protein DMG01_23010 [Acidobacteriota bacterium]
MRTIERSAETEGIRAAKYTSPYRDVVRAKIVLLAADGLRKTSSRLAIAASAGIVPMKTTGVNQVGTPSSRSRGRSWLGNAGTYPDSC